MDKIIIRDLLVRGPIGISDEERSQPQDILINVVLFTETSKAAETDSIYDCVNYSIIVKKIITLFNIWRNAYLSRYIQVISNIRYD